MKVDLAKRKSLGAFYTPSSLSDILCNWAIRERTDTVLEPSFGGCGFLTSAVKQLEKLGSSAPQNNIYGCDIDPDAFGHLSSAFGDVTDLSRFALGNFLDLAHPRDWPSFDVVIGNPPYLHYRKIDPAARSRALDVTRAEGVNLDLRSSLWAYFVVLGASHLKTGGRCAWVLPASFLFSNYSRTVRNFVASRFSRSRAFLVKERLFLDSGTEEQTVVLLAEGYDPTATISDFDVSLSQHGTLKALDKEIEAWRFTETESLAVCGDSVLTQLCKDARTQIDALQDRCPAAPLGSG
jgi:adenine-specific DNA-methyltransferase